MEKPKIPYQVLQRLCNAAPNYVVSENEGRSSGYYYSDRDESAAGYKAIYIYVQNGLAGYFDLFGSLISNPGIINPNTPKNQKVFKELLI